MALNIRVQKAGVTPVEIDMFPVGGTVEEALRRASLLEEVQASKKQMDIFLNSGRCSLESEITEEGTEILLVQKSGGGA